MPEVGEPIFSAQQIEIPVDFPDILKRFTKAAIRTQPRDLLVWSAAYFRALSKGEKPPVKEFYEPPGKENVSGLTLGLLKVLYKQIRDKETVTRSELKEKWEGLCLDQSLLEELLSLGGFNDVIDTLELVALACSEVGENLTDTMRVVCEVLNADSHVVPMRVSLGVFEKVYRFLAGVDAAIPEEHVQEVIQHLQLCAERQDGAIYPRNFLSAGCPPLF